MLTLQSADAIRRIEAAIGYTFRDKRLLVQVFTRKTYMKVDPEAPDNEVLEFYGDMLMSYHVTTYFVEKFAHMLDDGLYFMRTVEQFTEMRSHYVRNQYLTERIKQLIPNIDRLVRAQNARVELPKDNQKAYADLFESLIGAVYLDSYQDDKLIRAFILRHLNIEPKEASDPPAIRSGRTVTVLPSVTLSMEPDDPMAADEEVSADAPPSAEEPLLSASEPHAEPTDKTAAAIVAWHEETPSLTESPLEVPSAQDATVTAPALSEEVHPMQDELNAFCREAGYEIPVYGEAPKNAPNARPVAACTVRFRNGRGKPVKISLNDSGKTLAEATERAAAKMLKKLTEQQKVEQKVAEKRVTDSTDAKAVIVAAPVAELLIAESVAAATSMVETPDVAMPAPETLPLDPTPEIPAPEAVPTPCENADVAEAAAKPVTEPVAEILTETITDTVTDTVTEVAAEAIAEMVAETVTEATVQTLQKPPRKTSRKRTSATEKAKPVEDNRQLDPIAEVPALSEEQVAGESPIAIAPSVETLPDEKKAVKVRAPRKKATTTAKAADKAPVVEASEISEKKPRRRTTSKKNLSEENT